MIRGYKSPEGFKSALEQRLRDRAAGYRTTFERERSLVIFDRLLARIGQVFGDCVTLKGGFALELRLARARATNDVDLRMMGPPAGLLGRLQAAGRLDLGDFMRFEVDVDPGHPAIVSAGVRYDGQRFRAVCQIAGRSFGNPFGIDVAYGDPIFGETETIIAPDVLDFIGVPPPSIRVYPIESHLAERLHAYTMVRHDARMKPRVKDLPDLALIATTRSLRSDAIRAALRQTFTYRATHEVPRALPDPPPAWAGPYTRFVAENRLPWPTLAALTDAARRFLDPVLRGGDSQVWSPQAWSWSTVAGDQGVQ